MSPGSAVKARTGHETSAFEEPVGQFQRRIIPQTDGDRGHLFGRILRAIYLEIPDLGNSLEKLFRQFLLMGAHSRHGHFMKEFERPLPSRNTERVVRAGLVLIRQEVWLDFLFRLA